jgi:hypothetical protein
MPVNNKLSVELNVWATDKYLVQRYVPEEDIELDSDKTKYTVPTMLEAQEADTEVGVVTMEAINWQFPRTLTSPSVASRKVVGIIKMRVLSR